MFTVAEFHQIFFIRVFCVTIDLPAAFDVISARVSPGYSFVLFPFPPCCRDFPCITGLHDINHSVNLIEFLYTSAVASQECYATYSYRIVFLSAWYLVHPFGSLEITCLIR